MAALQVFLFGRFRVCRGDLLPIEVDGDKARELLCYLLLHRRRPQPRDTLATLLWPESSPPRAKKNLRQALWQLQAALQSCSVESDVPALVQAEPDWIRVNGGHDFWLDVAAFEHAFATVRGVPGEELDSERLELVTHAADLYTGELLEGWYQDWCLHERERLAGMYRAMLDKLMDRCVVGGDYETGLTYGERLLAEDPARERVHRRLMRLFYLRGDRTEALRQYERCVAALASELGVRPSRRTVALYEQLRADRLDAGDPALDDVVGSARGPHSESPALSRSLRRILGQLNQLRGVLAEVQDQLRDQIQTAEQPRKG